jgi:hypothetical protein
MQHKSVDGSISLRIADFPSLIFLQVLSDQEQECGNYCRVVDLAESIPLVSAAL